MYAFSLLGSLKQPLTDRAQCCDLLALRAIYHFDLAQLVPLEGEISFQDIAAKCNPKLDEGRLKRFLQMGMANNIFQEKRAGYVSHTVASRLLRDDAGFRANLGKIP